MRSQFKILFYLSIKREPIPILYASPRGEWFLVTAIPEIETQ